MGSKRLRIVYRTCQKRFRNTPETSAKRDWNVLATCSTSAKLARDDGGRFANHLRNVCKRLRNVCKKSAKRVRSVCEMCSKSPRNVCGACFTVLKTSAKRARSVLWNASRTSSKCLLHIRKMCSGRLRNAPKLLETSTKVHEMSAKCAPNVRETCSTRPRNVLWTSAKRNQRKSESPPKLSGTSAEDARNVCEMYWKRIWNVLETSGEVLKTSAKCAGNDRKRARNVRGTWSECQQNMLEGLRAKRPRNLLETSVKPAEKDRKMCSKSPRNVL